MITIKNIFIRFLIIISVIFLFFCFVEICLRILIDPPENIILTKNETQRIDKTPKQAILLPSHPEDGGVYFETPAGRRLMPNLDVVIENHSLSKQKIIIKTNSLGYRNKELSVKTKKRILFLGDSITFGDYLNEENTFVRLTEKLLEKKGADFETINAGVGSIGIENELAILRETGLSTKPDIVILGFYLNDFEQSLGIKMLRTPVKLKWSWTARLLFKNLSIFKAIFKKENASALAVNSKEMRIWFNEINSKYPEQSGDFKNSNLAFNKIIRENIRDWGMSWSEKGWTKMLPVFEEFSRLSKIHNFKL